MLIMKKLFLLGILSVAGVQGCITIHDEKTISENVYKGYSEVVDLNGVSQAQAFDASKMWMAKVFTSANNVIQYADKENGTIIGKGNFALKCPPDVRGMNCLAYTSTRAEFTLKIEVKDQKARLIFSDVHQAVNNYPFFDDKSKPIVDAQIKEMVKSYQADVLKQKNESKDW